MPLTPLDASITRCHIDYFDVDFRYHAIFFAAFAFAAYFLYTPR